MIENKIIKSYTIKFALAQALYWMSLCAIKGFMSVLLLDRGYSNTQIGLILAISSTITVFMQPMVASFADKHRNIPLNRIIAFFAAFSSALAAVAVFLLTASLALSAVMVLSVIIITVLYPLINSLYVMLGESGIEINYGVGRAAGSLGYALFSLLLGRLLETLPTVILPLSGLILLIAFTLTSLLLWDKRDISGKPQLNGDCATNEATSDSAEQALSVFTFIRRNLRYMLFLLGVALVFYDHTNVSDYLAQVTASVGGTSTDLGIAVFIAAIVELPAMLFFNKLLKRISCRTLLRISAVSFVIKHLLVYFANSVATLFISQLFQMTAFALFLPASVYYVGKLLRKADAVKGQAFVTSAIALGGVLASLASGRILDLYGSKTMLLVGAVVSAIGAAIIFFSVENTEKRNSIC